MVLSIDLMEGRMENFWSLGGNVETCYYGQFDPDEDVVAVTPQEDDDVSEMMRRMTLHGNQNPLPRCYGVERGVFERYESLRSFANRSVERNRARVRQVPTVEGCQQLLGNLNRDFIRYKATGSEPLNLTGEFLSFAKDADQFRTPEELIGDMNTIHVAILQKYLKIRIQEISMMHAYF